MALRLPYIPVTRVENFCASDTEAFRGAVYAVASGACDIALAMGVEKLKDTGYGGLPQRGRGSVNDLFWAKLAVVLGTTTVGGLVALAGRETEQVTSVKTPWRVAAGLSGLGIVAFLVSLI